MKTAHIFILGFVQGVGFRYFVRNKALDLGLCGWVRNLPDSRVEAIFQGKKEDIERMIQFCRKGPFLSEVKGVDVRWEEAEEKLEGFEIVV